MKKRTDGSQSSFLLMGRCRGNAVRAAHEATGEQDCFFGGRALTKNALSPVCRGACHAAASQGLLEKRRFLREKSIAISRIEFIIVSN